MSTVDILSQTQVITVVSPTQTITVNPLTASTIVIGPTEPSVTIVNAGPVGPAGSGAGYNHTQSSALTTWTINHNLGYNPSVQAFTAGSLEVYGEVQHISNNQTLIYFNAAISGSARLI